MIVETLGAAAAIVTIAGGVYASAAWWRGGRRVDEPDAEVHKFKSWFQKRRRPLDVELLPQQFEVRLTNTVPDVQVFVYAVNHLNRKITVEALSVEQFRLSSGHPLGTIQFGSEIEIDARRSRVLMCQRVLADSETRALEVLPVSPMPNASMTLCGRVRAGRKLMKIGPDSGVCMNGYIALPVASAAPVSGSRGETTKMDRFVET